MALALCFFSYSNSLADTSENLINPQAWQGATYGNDPGGCCASISGNGALYDNNTNTIMFSYGRDLLAQTIAINQALALSGVQVDGYQYGWTYRLISNSGRAGDELIFTVEVRDMNGNVVENYQYNRSASPHDQWYTESGTQLFSQSYPDPQSIALRIQGMDGGFWGGYYGPEVKDVMLKLIYTADPCAGNPLYDPSCNGYSEAYAQQQYDQNCSANALYDPGCPGYYQAYEAQQCNADPLYSPSCPGYQQAYYDQQCSADPLYDSGCPGYQQAYFDQQCKANPLYDAQCTGYAEAYLSQQCGINPLYDTRCNGYAEAYQTQQCGISPLYDPSCLGYETAFYAQQCAINPLYDSGCIGYDAAYFTQQCGIDALYDRSCPGYNEAYALENIVNVKTSEVVIELPKETVAETRDPVKQLTEVSVSGDSTVDQVLREQKPAEVISYAAGPISNPSRSMEQQVDTRRDSNNDRQAGKTSGDAKADPKGDNKSGEQTVQSEPKSKQDSRREKVKELMKERAKELAKEMGEAATLAAQQAIQSAVIASMGTAPGFDAYSISINGGTYGDATGYKPTQLPESRAGLRNGLAQQLMHERMIEQQYGAAQ